MKDLYLFLRGLGGSILDIYRFATFKFINPCGSTKFRMINTIRKKTGATVFVEAGTFHGSTARRCSIVFDRVYTIELVKERAEQAARYLADKKNVTVLQGDAVEILPRLLQEDRIKNVVMFLDAHFGAREDTYSALPELGYLSCRRIEITFNV